MRMRINANRFEVKTTAVHGFQQDLTVVNNVDTSDSNYFPDAICNLLCCCTKRAKIKAYGTLYLQ